MTSSVTNEMVDLQKIKALAFDLDDTLWAITPVIERAEAASRDWLISHYPDTQALIDQGAIANLRLAVCREFPDRLYDLSFLRKECLGRLLEQSGYTRDGVEQAFAVFKYQRDTLELYDDVMPFFEQLHPRFVRIALTNGNASLERTPLKDHFQTHLNAAEVRAAKPAAAIFEAALNRHQLEPHELLHIGDDLISDIGGATRLGIPTVWVNRFGRCWNEGHSRPHFVVNSLTQLGSLLLSAAPQAAASEN